jgi:hypothetical protein
LGLEFYDSLIGPYKGKAWRTVFNTRLGKAGLALKTVGFACAYGYIGGGNVHLLLKRWKKGKGVEH